jgi:predicted transcriptional regulator
MTPNDINAAIRNKGFTQARIARELCVTCNAVSLVVHNRAKSKRIALAICRITGLSKEALWPIAERQPVNLRDLAKVNPQKNLQQR